MCLEGSLITWEVFIKNQEKKVFPNCVKKENQQKKKYFKTLATGGIMSGWKIYG